MTDLAATSLAALWLPILLAAVFAFIASTLINMLPLWHKNDWPPLPDEAAARAAIGPLNVPPGDYTVPRCNSMQEMGSEAFKAKQNEGPNWLITVLPKGQGGMAASLLQWFLFLLLVAFFSAYVASHALPPGAHYTEVFRMVGATAFMGFALGQLPQSIWFKRQWSTTFKHMFDDLIYALLTAGTFGWLWP